MSRRPSDPVRRFFKLLVIEGSGCWTLRTYRQRTGYASFWWRDAAGRVRNIAHRFAYATFVGPIPDGYTIDHLCRNRACVNPAHLEAVTQRENIIRGTAPPARNARATHCKHGHAYDEKNTYRRPDGSGRGCRACRDAASKRRSVAVA